MQQPIAGVAPPELGEVTAMTVWPTIGAIPAGRLVGRLCGLRLGYGFFTLGKLLAVLCIPLGLAVFAWQLMPYVCRRYALTNRRIIIRRGLSAREGQWISLDDIATIDIEILPGQEWLRAGDLIFRRGGIEVLRLSGVYCPETFRQVCLKARDAVVLVRKTLEKQAILPHSTPVLG